MFDIGWSELLVIGIVALVVIGPKDLPKVLRALGTMMSKVRSMASEFQGQFQDAMREAELADLKKEAEKLASSATSAIQNPLQSIENEIQKPADAPLQLQPPPPAPEATDAQVNAAIPAPPQAEPVNIEPAPIAPAATTSADTVNEPVRKQGTGA
jgi:sec-independent protein translocase protein TatB